MIDVDIGCSVVNKRNHCTGVVVKIDTDSVFIDIPNSGIKCVTISNFNKWWDKQVNDDTEETVQNVKEEPKVNLQFGMGDKLFDKFIDIIKSYKDDNILVFYKNPKKIVIRYNNRIIFDVSICRKKLVVMAHPNSLTPDNYRRITKLYPKSWNNSLRAKFVFYDTDQIPLMKTIISDGIFYRQNI